MEAGVYSTKVCKLHDLELLSPKLYLTWGLGQNAERQLRVCFPGAVSKLKVYSEGHCCIQCGALQASSSRTDGLAFGRMEASCLELALEGERLCKAGDFKAGAAFFEAAVQVGTEDLKTLSAIYSQLGNAYFYLKEYSKALEYHKHDLTLAR